MSPADTTLTVAGFRWRTMEGEVLTLAEMSTKHIFNSCKMVFNHLAEEYDGEPVWFQHRYGDYQRGARGAPERLVALVVFFIQEIERRKDLPEKYVEPYQAMLRQLVDNPALMKRRFAIGEALRLCGASEVIENDA